MILYEIVSASSDDFAWFISIVDSHPDTIVVHQFDRMTFFTGSIVASSSGNCLHFVLYSVGLENHFKIGLETLFPVILLKNFPSVKKKGFTWRVSWFKSHETVKLREEIKWKTKEEREGRKRNGKRSPTETLVSLYWICWFLRKSFSLFKSGNGIEEDSLRQVSEYLNRCHDRQVIVAGNSFHSHSVFVLLTDNIFKNDVLRKVSCSFCFCSQIVDSHHIKCWSLSSHLPLNERG